jgi:CBS domain-containing protein
MMAQNDCGEIPVIDTADRPIGVVTDRDIVCRVVAEDKNPAAHTAESCMSKPVVTVREDAPIADVISTMEDRRIRRVLVTDADGCCVGIIAQADIATSGPADRTSELVTEISRH